MHTIASPCRHGLPAVVLGDLDVVLDVLVTWGWDLSTCLARSCLCLKLHSSSTGHRSGTLLVYCLGLINVGVQLLEAAIVRCSCRLSNLTVTLVSCHATTCHVMSRRSSHWHVHRLAQQALGHPAAALLAHSTLNHEEPKHTCRGRPYPFICTVMYGIMPRC